MEPPATLLDAVIAMYRQNAENLEMMEELTWEELVEFREVVEVDIRAINKDLALARQLAHDHKHYADNSWFRRATDARAIKVRLLRAIQDMTGRKRDEKAAAKNVEDAKTYAGCLLIAMGKLLTPEQKQAVIAEAGNMAKPRATKGITP